VLNEANRLSYSDKLTKSHTKVKTTWNIIRVQTGKQRKNEDNIKPRKINPLTFNNYLLTVAVNTTHNIFTQTTDNNRNYKCYWDLTHRSPCPKIRFNNITTAKNEKVISSLHPKNSYGYDEILMNILKISTPCISSPLCYIFNKVILTFDLIFQGIWGNTTQEINDHINNNGILANEQFGFCTKLSTETVFYNLINKVLAVFNN
jgi:hypothetical protein